jgi:hypothetical protein
LVKGVRTQIGTDLVHDEIDGCAGMWTVLCLRRLDSLLRIIKIHDLFLTSLPVPPGWLPQRSQQRLHLWHQVDPPVGSTRERDIDPGFQDGFGFIAMPKSDEGSTKGQMRGDMGGIQLHGHSEMLRCLAEIATLLQNLIAQSIPAKKPLRIFGYHLSECIEIHAENP